MKKIIFVTGGMNSGSEHCLLRLITQLDPLEFKVIIVSQYNDFIDNFYLYNVKHYSKEIFYNNTNVIIKLWRITLRILGYNPLINYYKKIIKVEKPDLVYLNHLTISNEFNVFINSGINYVVHGHSLEQYYYNFDFHLIYERLNNAKFVISTSIAQLKTLNLFKHNLKSSIIYPPINLNKLQGSISDRIRIRKELGIPDNTFVFCMASTYLNYNKDPLRFVRLGQRILNLTSRNLYFLWIGGPEDSTAYNITKAYATSMKFTCFKMIGNCDQNAYLQYLNASDSLTLISLEESFSVICCEAIALGKPVVAFECGGVNEIVNDKNGILIENYSLDSMAHASLKIINQIDNYNIISMRDSLRSFDSKIQFDLWREVIQNNINHENTTVGK